MDYYMNPRSLAAAFPVPSAVVDRYFKLSKAEHIKVLLFVLRNMANDLKEEEIAEGCGVSTYDVKEALLYWADAGILLPKEMPPIEVKTEKKKSVQSKREKPTRSDILKRSLENPKIQYLMGEAQIKFGRNLKETEKSTLVWLYDDEGMDISVILLVIQYAVAKGKDNVRFIESVAIDLLKKEIDNVADADAELHKRDLGDKVWSVVCAAFGIERRKPSDKELETSVKWLTEWKISKEMLNAAYNECIDKKSKFSFPYVAKIIENWYNAGITSPEDIKKKPAKKEKGGDYVSYDLDLYEKMINSKD